MMYLFLLLVAIIGFSFIVCCGTPCDTSIPKLPHETDNEPCRCLRMGLPHACQPGNEVLLLCWLCAVFMFSTSYVGCEEEIWLGL